MFRIGIVGYGIVGQAVRSAIKPDVAVEIFDPKYKRADKDAINNCNVVFICVPTPTKAGRQDTSILDEVVEWIKPLKVVKSTVLPEWFYSHPDIVYNPEFLNQNNAIEDFLKQKTLILGGEISSVKAMATIYKERFDLQLKKIIFCSNKEASELKYVHNLYHAYKALFWNYVQDITSNQRKIFSLYSAVTGATESGEMARICADGKPGVGGACFPKDLVAMDTEMKHPLTSLMVCYNSFLRQEEMDFVLL